MQLDVQTLDKVAIAFNVPQLKKGYGLELCQVEFNKLSKNLECLRNSLKLKDVNGTKLLHIHSMSQSNCKNQSRRKNGKGKLQISAYFAPKYYGRSSKDSTGMNN